ncbi:MAG: hypothetical protein K0R17_1763 [Rariglobus sp.]|jgi:hypothetical protein|nr:hypothetical protein [Rariglobus sp.]
MKKTPERETLLDVLAVDDGADDREALLQLTLRHVRHRRARRRATGGALVAGMAWAMVWSGWHWRREEPRVAIEQPAIVHPGPRLEIVTTQPLSKNQLVKTEPGRISVVRSVAGGATIVETARALRSWTEIDDRQLLAMVDDQAVLVRREPGHAELVFINPADRMRFGLPQQVR